MSPFSNVPIGLSRRRYRKHGDRRKPMLTFTARV